MSDAYDNEQMDKEVGRNMKGQTFIVTIRDQVDSIPAYEIQDAVIREYDSSQITGSEVDVEKVEVIGERRRLIHGDERGSMRMIYEITDAA